MSTDLNTNEHINLAVNELVQAGFTVERVNAFFLAMTTSMAFILACIRTADGVTPITKAEIDEQIDAFAFYIKKTSESIFEDPKFRKAADDRTQVEIH